MRHRRRLFVLLVSVLVSVVAIASGGAVGAAGPTPLPGLEDAARVIRTSDGIAHLEASTRHDLYFLNGWVHAEDRLFQMDVSRRLGSGTLAELLGQGALPSDVQLRTIGLRRAAERSWTALDPASRAAVQAYSDGVNAFVASHPLPPEYAALRLTRVAPWTPVDSVVVGKLVAFRLSFDLDLDNTVALQAYVEAGLQHGFDGQALFFHDLPPFRPFSAAATVPDATEATSATGPLSEPPSVMAGARLAQAADLAERYLASVERVPLLRAAIDGDVAEGSNEWALSGRHTLDGRAIVANDPHLALDAPSTLYPVHLRADGIDVAGEGFAGSPGVVIGQNARIAWGATVTGFDVTDTYLEVVRPDPASQSGLSTVYQAQLEPVIPIPETFRINTRTPGSTDDVVVVPPGGIVPAATLVVPRRNNGPIIQLDAAAGTALSLQYTGFSPTQEIRAVLTWDEAENLDDFRRGLAFFDVGSQNFVYSDRQGHVAYFTSGEVPVREDLQAGHVAGLPPFFVRDGRGGNEWLPLEHPQPGQAVPFEVLPPEELPHVIDPPAGWFVNANNDPTGATLDNDPYNQSRPGGGIYYLASSYDGLRGGRITEMLRARLAGGGKVGRGEVETMQADTVLLDAEFFVPRIRAAWQRTQSSGVPELAAFAADLRIGEAVARLADWDFSTPTGLPEGYDASDPSGLLVAPSETEVANSVAATIYAVWRSRFVAGTIDATLAPYGVPQPRDQRALTALRQAYEGEPLLSGLDFFAVPGVTDPEDARAVKVLTAVRVALDRLAGEDFAAAFGRSTNQADYRWGRLHRLVLGHRLGGPFSAPPAFGAFPAPLPGLAGVPVDGGLGTVDSAAHNLRGNASESFRFTSGPARRYIGVMSPSGPIGGSALPGGVSALATSAHYLDQLRPYLTNEYYPVRVSRPDILAGTESVTRFVPG